MEGFYAFICILSIIWSILCIVLFFKIWGMTDDVRAIKKYLLPNEEQQETSNETINNSISNLNLDVDIKKGDIVINKENGEELIVLQVHPDGDVTCKTNKKFGLRRVVKITCLEKLEDNKI